MPLHRRVPKRGFNNIFRIEYAVVNLDASPSASRPVRRSRRELLRERRPGARPHAARSRCSARGEITKALTVQAHKFSGKAAEKIAAAGGHGR